MKTIMPEKWQIVALVSLVPLNLAFMYLLYDIPGAAWPAMIPSTLWSIYIAFKYIPFAEIWQHITQQENDNGHP